MFRCRQKINSPSSAVILVKESIVEEDGTVTENLVSAFKNLAPAESTDLKTMLKAGVNLQQVSTKILGAQTPDSSEPSETEPSETEPSNKD